MRPLKLQMQAFGPYKGHEIIDFNELSSHGLFLICGETGSGKTMILDGMTFALFGKSSGHMRDELESLRYRGSDRSVDTFVIFDFEAHGSIYRFERRLEQKRVNLSQSQNVYRLEDEGAWRPLFENCKAADANNKAVELLGLEYDQFRQVIILPQGQFEQLLTSNSEDKEKILTSIFGVDKWQKIADRLYEQAKAKYDGLKDLKEEVDNRLKDENCETVEDFEQYARELKAAIERRTEEYLSLKVEEEAAAIEKGMESARAFAQLHALEARRTVHEERREENKRNLERLMRSERANQIKPILDKRDEAQKEFKRRSEAVEKVSAGLGTKREALELAGVRLAELNARSKDNEALKERKVRLEGCRETYRVYESLVSAEKTAFKHFEDAERAAGYAGAVREKAKRNAVRGAQEYDAAMDRYREMTRQYLADICGYIAEELEDGKPCPVCGSISHPSPAGYTGERVTKADLDEAKKVCDRLKNSLDELTGEVEKTSAGADAGKEELSRRQNEWNLAKQARTEASKGLAEGISNAEELEKAINKINMNIEAFENELQKALNDRLDAEKALATAQQELDNAVNERNDAEKTAVNTVQHVRNALANAMYTDEEAARTDMLTPEEQGTLRNLTTEYRTESSQLEKGIKEMLRELEGVSEPDTDALRARRDELECMKQEYTEWKAAKTAELERAGSKLDNLRMLKSRFEAEWKQADDDLTLAKNLRGDTGIGLQRYVLGIMFSSVIHEANRMLEHVHAGRYRLFTSDEKVKGTNKRGLDLKVEDRYYDGENGRSVKTLSGGEKFLVSLALSIGMSSVAARGGIRIEAMFVDEGFGSLDNDSIEDAITVLNEIRDSNGMVGIISHVRLLEDTIPTKLIVKKSRDGSTISREIG